jgi:hypothetical protein
MLKIQFELLFFLRTPFFALENIPNADLVHLSFLPQNVSVAISRVEYDSNGENG